MYVCRWIFKPWLACIASGRKKPCTSIAWSPLVHIHTPTYIHTYLTEALNIKHIHTYIHTYIRVCGAENCAEGPEETLSRLHGQQRKQREGELPGSVCMYVCIVTSQTICMYVCMYVCRGLKWMPSKPPPHPHRRSLSTPMETKPPRKSTPVRKPDLPFIHTYIHTFIHTYIHTYIHRLDAILGCKQTRESK